MNKRLPFLLILLLIAIFTPVLSFSQTATTISGKIYDKENIDLPLTRLMIINKRTNHGLFADAEGKFSFSIDPTDTIIFSAIGFKVRNVCFKDSLINGNSNFQIALSKLYFELKEVSVFANRGLNEIQNDIDKLGVKKTYSTTGANAFESPITALYERFSKFEQSKRKVAEWENEDLKRDILRDLFRLYVKNDVIDLKDDEFDAFIKYLNLNDEFIKSASQFELVMAIKGKYESFKYRWK